MRLKNLVFFFAILTISSLIAQGEEKSGKLPLIYDAYGWVNFCPHHLKKDPEGCSSWICSSEHSEKNPCFVEEEDFFIFPFSSISPKLIANLETANGLQKIPTLPESKCDYGVCKRCKKRIIRTVDWAENVEEESKRCYRTTNTPLILYKCDCIASFIDRNDLTFKNIVQQWEFCNKPACFSGYFESHMSKYFSRFHAFSCYCKENPECECYWSEKGDFRKKVLDIISEHFWDEILEGEIVVDASGHLPIDIAEKLLLYPQRKLLEHVVHSFFYSDLKACLRNFDREALARDFGEYWVDNPVSRRKWAAFCDKVLSEVRLLFLDQYKTCYNMHPHPKIRVEINAIFDELNGIDR